MADDARLDELRGLLAEALRVDGYPPFWQRGREGIADLLLPVVERFAGGQVATALNSAADELHVLRFNADEDDDARWPKGSPRVVPDSFYRGIQLAKLALRARAAAVLAAGDNDRRQG